MRSEKYRQLIDRLITKTDRRELAWKEGVYPDSFQVAFPNYSLTIIQRQDDRDEIFLEMSIINSDGYTIDRFSEFDLEQDYHNKLYGLYHEARRQALGVDKALDDILIALEDY